MNKGILIISIIFLTAIEIFLSFYIKIGFVVMLFVLLMGIFIIINKKTFSLAAAVSIFVYGAILAFMQNHFYISKNFIIKKIS